MIAYIFRPDKNKLIICTPEENGKMVCKVFNRIEGIKFEETKEEIVDQKKFQSIMKDLEKFEI